MCAGHGHDAFGVTIAQALDHLHVLLRRVHRLGAQAQAEHACTVGAIPVVQHRGLQLAVSRQIEQMGMEALVGLRPLLQLILGQRLLHGLRGLNQRSQFLVARLAPGDQLHCHAFQGGENFVDLAHVGGGHR